MRPPLKRLARPARATHAAHDAPGEPLNVPAVDDIDGNLSYASRRVWGMPLLRPHQSTAIKKMLFDKECGGKLLIVARTEGEGRHT